MSGYHWQFTPNDVPPLERLTSREREIMAAYATHGTCAAAAHALLISESTLKNKLSGSIYPKLGVTNMLGALKALGWLRVAA